MKTKLVTILFSLAGILAIISVFGDAVNMFDKALAREQTDTVVITISLMAFLGLLLLGGIYIIISALFGASTVLVKDDLITVQYDFLPRVSFSSDLDFKQFTVWNFEADSSTEGHVRASLFVKLPYLFVVTEKTEGNFHTRWKLPFDPKK